MSEFPSGSLRRTRRFPLSVCVVAASLILMGCSSVNSDGLDYKPEVRAVAPAKEEVNKISSSLIDWMSIKGKVSGPGAGVSVCEAVDPDLKTHYTIYHPWSIYDLNKGTFAEAMQSLREQLPKHGWDITKDGETKSRAKNPEIVAVNPTSHHTVQIEWARERSGDLKELISISITSRCYRAPEGTDLH
ncbi:hypothetical protein ACFVWZ_05970 [Streptomyces sp. NPDC058200]|uniref:hypothetical protein n=1 Tax=Streptomyces sp. NPDC058200 TaxID=3346378 RepID=UPI0036E55638